MPVESPKIFVNWQINIKINNNKQNNCRRDNYWSHIHNMPIKVILVFETKSKLLLCYFWGGLGWQKAFSTQPNWSRLVPTRPDPSQPEPMVLHSLLSWKSHCITTIFYSFFMQRATVTVSKLYRNFETEPIRYSLLYTHNFVYHGTVFLRFIYTNLWKTSKDKKNIYSVLGIIRIRQGLNVIPNGTRRAEGAAFLIIFLDIIWR